MTLRPKHLDEYNTICNRKEKQKYNTLFIVNNHIMNHTKHTCTIQVFPSTIQNIIHFSNGSREKKIAQKLV